MKLLRVIAVNLAVLLGLALAVELAFGEWIGTHPLGRLAIPRNVKITLSAAPLYSGGGEFIYRRDAMGFRGSGVDPARITILTLGGSTTNQLYLPEEATWQAVLARSLRQMGHDTVVANAGLDGQSTVGMIADLDLWIPNVPHLKPRLALAYVGINDVHIRPTWRDGLHFVKFNRALEQRSALVRLWTIVAGSIRAQRADLGHRAVDFARAQWTDQPAQPDWQAGQLEANLAAYKARLVRIAELIERLGAVPVFISQTRADYRLENGRLFGIAKSEGPNGVDQGRALARFNAATLEVCRERRVACLDLASELHFADGDFYDYEHNTPQGAEKIGRWLAGRLAGLI
jgi:lysophospholipase L1-like esterase